MKQNFINIKVENILEILVVSIIYMEVVKGVRKEEIVDLVIISNDLVPVRI